MKLSKKRIAVLLSGPSALILNFLSNANPSLIDKVYTKGIYLIFSRIIGFITSLVPFSLAEFIIYYGGAVAALTYIVFLIKKLAKTRKKRLFLLKKAAVSIASVLSIWYFLFIITSGFNYNNISFAEQSGWDIAPSSAEELYLVCYDLAEKANEYRELVNEDENGMVLAQDVWATAKEAPTLFSALEKDYPMLGGWAPRAKPVMASIGMSHLNITGIFIPFTYECNVNTDIPDYWIPATMLHETAHYKGFMREEEANFLAYFASIHSDNYDFKYSGVMTALSHALNKLYSADSEKYFEVTAMLSDKVQLDREINYNYWKSFEGIVADTSSAVNDVYLRANNQVSGVKSYGEMADLLLAYYRTQAGSE